MAPPKTTPDAEAENVVSLIRNGWEHLRLQSPLAAWGSWQEAIRLDPDSKAAQQALATLESAGELPASARTRYRFMNPATVERRERWDARLRGTVPEALAGAANVFSNLTEEDPDDAEAWYNRALCLSWIGQNREAVACLDRFVTLRAGSAFDMAVSAWILAEVLRQGRGAEALADDLRFAAVVGWSAGETAQLAQHIVGLRRLPTPEVPTSSTVYAPQVSIYEWLDEPGTEGSITPSQHSSSGPLVLATLYDSSGSMRLSSPRGDTLEMALERLAQVIDLEDREVRREAAPLPLPFLDAAVWTLRIPPGTDPTESDRLTREHVESYFENFWIHVKRQGLDGQSPLEASARAAIGDHVARAKLTALVRFREQLGTRPSVGSLYQGYPFDRLRTRLGLEPADGNAFETDDFAAASAEKLASLDPATLADARLASAFESAEGLRDDRLTEKFAVELLGRGPNALGAVDLITLAACLVRVHVSKDQKSQAIESIRRMEPLANDVEKRQLSTWHAEILAREGQADEAVAIYRDLLKSVPEPAVTALDAAETLIDNGELQEAPSFLEIAIQSARETGLLGVEKRSKLLLESL